MASEKAKELAAKQKAAIKAEKLRRKNSDDPRDWGRWRQFVEAYKRTAEVDPSVTWWMLGVGLGLVALIAVLGIVSNMAWWAWLPLALAVLGFLIMYYVTIVFGCIVSGVGGVLAYQRYQQDKGAMSVVGIVVNVLVCVFGIIAYIIP